MVIQIYQLVLHRFSPPEEKEFLRRYVQDHTWTETAEEFNKEFGCDLSRDAVKAAGDRYGIRTGRNGRFEKGSIPANKGKKMSADAYKKCAPTMFYKGQPPTNHKPVGTISVRNNYKKALSFSLIFLFL